MHYKTLFILLLLSTITYGQEIQKKLAIDVCKCLNETEKIDAKTFRSCFSNNLANYKPELEELIDKNSTVSEHEQGRLLGKKLFADMQTDLIYNCDIYYNSFQEMRSKSLLAMNEHYTKELIDSIDLALEEKESIDLILERGKAYFAKNQLKEAKEQYNKCLSLNPDHMQSKFYLAWIKETEGNYQEAIELYQAVYNSTKKQEMLIFMKLAKRKSTE